MLLESAGATSPAVPDGPTSLDAGDRIGRQAARRTLLGQIARLEGELVEQRCSNWPRTHPEARAQRGGVGGCGRAVAEPGSAYPAAEPGGGDLAAEPGGGDPEGRARMLAIGGYERGTIAGRERAAIAGRERGAQLLGIEQLEALRDELIHSLSAERRALARRTLAEEESRRLREELMLDPAANAGARVRNADAGEGGCGEVRSEPVAGLLGMLMGWWRVVASSGCP
jgi:hypothetical protein